MRLRPFLLYAVVGATGTCVQYLILVLVVSFGLAGPVSGSSAGAVAGAVVNYILNYRFTFRSNEKHTSAAPKFFFVALIGLGVNWVVMKNIINLFNIHYLLAQCAATASVLVITFLANRTWSFKSESLVVPGITDVLEKSILERNHTQANVSMVLVMALSFGIFSLILAAYIGLIPFGHWQDEFLTFPGYIGDEWKGLLSRLTSWSPRPFSELLLFAYAHMVERYHSPLIGMALRLCG